MMNGMEARNLPIQFFETALKKCDESKISLIPVVFDVNNRSIVTKGPGGEGHDPVSSAAEIDQKGLLLERYEHIAYSED